MSSRQEEKERRRRERLAAEEAQRGAASRRRRMQIVFGAVLVIVLVGAGTALAVGLLGGSSSGGSASVPKGGADIPSQQQGDEKKAATAAGCTLKENLPNEGANHVDKTFTEKDYKQNPPTSGPHFPQWAQDGVYNPGDEPQLGELVHTLEHGRVDIQYKPGTPTQTVSQLETLVKSKDGGHHLLLFQNPTGMSYAVAATAWDNMIGCPAMNPRVFDALRTFIDTHIDHGPEIVP